jgi:hypothetical protein
MGFHLRQLTEDYDNRDFTKLKTDLLGPMGTKPRFTRPGAATTRAKHDLDQSLSEMKYELQRALDANKNPERDSVLIEQYFERTLRAMENFDRRTNPPEHGGRP